MKDQVFKRDLILSIHMMAQAEKILGNISITPIFRYPIENKIQNMFGQANLIFSDRMTSPKKPIEIIYLILLSL